MQASWQLYDFEITRNLLDISRAKETVEMLKGGAFMISVEKNNFKKKISKEENSCQKS